VASCAEHSEGTTIGTLNTVNHSRLHIGCLQKHLFVGSDIRKSHRCRISYLRAMWRKGFWATPPQAQSGPPIANLRDRRYRARPAALVDYDPTNCAASSTGSAASGFFAGIMVITTTLIRTKRVPRIVRRPSASPPRKYPTSTATTGFTYA